MTLIVSTMSGNCPLLLGDILISVPITSAHYEVHLPIQAVKFTGDAGDAISSFAQKTCIVAPNVAVAWSGSQFVAKTIIREMMQNFTSERPATFDTLKTFFYELDFPEAKDVHMVGLVGEGNNTVRFSCRCENA